MDSSRLRAVGLPVGVAAVVLYGLIGVCIGYPCASTGLRFGVWLERCPATAKRLRADVSAESLLRGASGFVRVDATMGFLEGDGAGATPRWERLYRGYSVDLELRDATGAKVEGLDLGRVRRDGGTTLQEVTLPAVPDGDYTLHATVDAGFEKAEADLALPLYAPAVVHLETDRPLYRPGQEVLLRSVVLRRTDLTPIDERPGKWRIRSPGGEEMLVERDRAAAFGVADGSFPLARDAEIGTWTAIYESGTARDEVTFRVEPFRLPRFSVELTPSAPWYRSSDAIRIHGVARYTSGAPIPSAPVHVEVRPAKGRWPMPLAWEEPIEVRTDASGGFDVDLGVVPGDLIEQAAFTVAATVTEAAGEAGTGATSLVLSSDPLIVDAVTELGDGLVEGFNNRLYLRVTSPDGVPLRDKAIRVTNPWVPDAPVREARTDADGVAALQVDPGSPVTVVDPAPPARPRPLARPEAYLIDARELGRSEALGLAERSAFDRVAPAVARCSDLAPSAVGVGVAVQTAASGAVTLAEPLPGTGRALGDCVAGALRAGRLPGGEPRTYALTWEVPGTTRPWLAASVEYALGGGLEADFTEAATGASACVAGASSAGGRAFIGHFRVAEGERRASVSLVDQGLLPASAAACVSRALASVPLAAPAGDDAIGVVRLDVTIPYVPGQEAPQPTTRVGYELQVASADEPRLRGRVVLPPGNVPPLRIRATPSLAAPGDQVAFDFLRGPSFTGALPDEVHLWEGSRDLGKAKLDPQTRKVTFTVPADSDGFLRVEEYGARAVVFVRRPDPLAVTLSTDRSAYRPGETAKLLVETTAGRGPVQAAVGLVGVDASLGQLAKLLGPDDWGRVTVRATADVPAFGSFDPRALALGQIAGENAAQAAVLRISQLPMDPAGDDRVAASATMAPDLESPLVTSFWRAFEHAATLERAWEESAPPGEVLQPAKMVEIWSAALDACAAEGKPATDAFARPLTLKNLPPDLLAELAPREMVSDGARLSEDVIDWPRFVAEEVQ